MTASAIADAWFHEMESTFGGLEVMTLDGSNRHVSGALAAKEIGHVGIYGISGTPQQLVRTDRAVRQSPTELLKVCTMRRGRCIIEQSGRELTIAPGEFGLYDTAIPYRLTFRGSWQCEVMTAPSTALGAPRAAIDEARARPWSASAGAGTLLAQFISACASMASPVTAASSHLATAGDSLLASVVLQDFEPGSEQIAEVLRHKIESYINQNLHNPDLCLEQIAAVHHVSVRTVQRLFSGTGAGLTSRVRKARLQAIRRELSDPRRNRLTISEVGARWCIHDAQWLAKAFKSEFGMSPSEFRKSAAAGDSAAPG
ncbi:helix-turn-helix domain-containing protein [Arthrobacter nitrophenolicus]|uniref:Helix-turn-helix domain-containing protein n=1 Tax=Arthrobacter nitrophenolicus TaxID=683150 RepID=A0A4R5XPF6_9MICC|nr:helix-turn-helix domain-containing protein [Arthrobacter nitrophenolicus]TDL33374.1 helix-turn-helix domain-containing protein [Arthrobacter nitrophenolicus]